MIQLEFEGATTFWGLKTWIMNGARKRKNSDEVNKRK